MLTDWCHCHPCKQPIQKWVVEDHELMGVGERERCTSCAVVIMIGNSAIVGSPKCFGLYLFPMQGFEREFM